MYKSKVTAKKVLKIEGQVLFYSILILVIANIIFKAPSNVKQWITYIFPISKNIYWFATAYMLIMIFSKYINKFIENLDKVEFKVLIFILLIIYFTLPTYLNIELPVVFIEKTVALYLIGAYIRKYNINKSENISKYKKKLLLYFTLNTMIIIISVYFNHITKQYILDSPIFFIQHENPLIALIAIYMFLIAISAKETESKVINTISSTTFGVYLIHDNPIVRMFLWEIIIGCTQYYDKPYMIINCIGTAVLVFTVCSIIDFVRIHTAEKIFMKIVDKAIKKASTLKNEGKFKIEIK